MTKLDPWLVESRGIYHRPFLSCFFPLNTSFPLNFTTQSSSLNSTVHPAAQSFVTEIKDLFSPGIIYPVVASGGSWGIGSVAEADDVIVLPFGMVTWMGLWSWFLLWTGVVSLR